VRWFGRPRWRRLTAGLIRSHAGGSRSADRRQSETIVHTTKPRPAIARPIATQIRVGPLTVMVHNNASACRRKLATQHSSQLCPYSRPRRRLCVAIRRRSWTSSMVRSGAGRAHNTACRAI
jgi:hypothetical protein